jgi:RNA polymerase sigma-70 factor (family 1)
LYSKGVHTSEEMLLAFHNGEEKVFNFFFREYYAVLCFFANKYVNDPGAAEDMVSEAFIQLWTGREKIKNEDHLKNYLYRAVTNLCFDHKQKIKTKEKYLQVVKSDHEFDENEFNKNIIEAETFRQVKEALDMLPGQCQKIFKKLFIEGRSVKETATELGLTISTVNNQKARGLKIIRGKLSDIFSRQFL